MDAPVGSEEEPVPAESGSRPERRISEAPTTAPTVGVVRELPDAVLGPEIGFRTPAMVLDGVAVGGYCVAAASLAGTAHLVAGSVRQDAYDFIAVGTGSLVAVVADGLGSKTYSQVGARLFCEGVLLAASKATAGETGADEEAGGTLSAPDLMWAGAAHTRQVARTGYGFDDRDIPVVAAVAVFGDDGCEIVRIGDVSAFAVGADGQFDELLAADTYCINEVRSSLPSSSPDDMERVVTQAGIIAIVTDGLASDLRTSPKIRSWLGERWQNPLGPYAMGESLRYRRQGSHDDRTAVVVWTNSEV